MSKININSKSNASTFAQWWRTGTPFIWINAAAVSVSFISVLGLLLVLFINATELFWPQDLVRFDYVDPATHQQRKAMGYVVTSESVTQQQLIESVIGAPLAEKKEIYQRMLIKEGNRDLTGLDFSWFLAVQQQNKDYPVGALIIERMEWGDFIGFLREVKKSGQVVATNEGDGEINETALASFNTIFEENLKLREHLKSVEKDQIGNINYQVEQIRLKMRRLDFDRPDDIEQQKKLLLEQKQILDKRFFALREELFVLYKKVDEDSLVLETASGKLKELKFSDVVHLMAPNDLSILQKSTIAAERLWHFLSDEPREANTEGGIFPAIFGTVLMVIIMSIIMMPMGVVAAIYLHEYASNSRFTQFIRISVNNLAGVPSIVYGVAGLGFFIYIIGGKIDEIFYPEALPSPTFGAPGLMWAALTLAFLTLPVVIVATEEGLSRIPNSIRHGSLALGATRAETFWRVILPIASPAMMTGLILAVARAAGEVAPLMLVGVVKVAPSLPLDGNFPYLHLSQKFMHLGFHIYDVGFQSSNIEAGRPLVFATAFLLVLVIVVLNWSAVILRNKLREMYDTSGV